MIGPYHQPFEIEPLAVVVSSRRSWVRFSSLNVYQPVAHRNPQMAYPGIVKGLQILLRIKRIPMSIGVIFAGKIDSIIQQMVSGCGTLAELLLPTPEHPVQIPSSAIFYKKYCLLLNEE